MRSEAKATARVLRESQRSTNHANKRYFGEVKLSRKYKSSLCNTMPILHIHSLVYFSPSPNSWTRLPPFCTTICTSKSICLDEVVNMLICHGCRIMEVQSMSSSGREIPAGPVARSRVKDVLDGSNFVVRHQTVPVTIWQIVRAIDHIYGPSEVDGDHGTIGDELTHCDSLLCRLGNIKQCWVKPWRSKEKELSTFVGLSGEITMR